MAAPTRTDPAVAASSAGLPVRTTMEDVMAVCGYLAKKPTGATLKEMKAVLGATSIETRKLNGIKRWGLIDEAGDRMRVLDRGRRVLKDGGAAALGEALREAEPYLATVERAAHTSEFTTTAVDVAAHWHENFASHVSSHDETLNKQVLAFFQLAQGAKLGQIVVGRSGAPTRFEFDPQAVEAFIGEETAGISDGESDAAEEPTPAAVPLHVVETARTVPPAPGAPTSPAPDPSAAPKPIFVGHGKNKQPLQQLTALLNAFRIPHRVVVDEANLGRPISQKVKETIQQCGSAILIFTRDEKFLNEAGAEVWRPSENVIHELGATSFVYGDRIVIFKEKGLNLPSNFQNIGYIEFDGDGIQARTAELLKELIGFGLVKVTPTA
jgi:hypothetical protein